MWKRGQDWLVETRVIYCFLNTKLNRCALCASYAHQLSRLSRISLSVFVLAIPSAQFMRPSLHSVSLTVLQFSGGFYPVSPRQLLQSDTGVPHFTWPTYLPLSPESFSRCRLRWTTPPSPQPVSLLPFIAKTLERVVFNQVSLFLSQNNKLDAKQSSFRSGHSTETVLLSHWSPPNCKSRFQIISPHSAGSIWRFWHCQSLDSPVHPLITGHHWDSTSLVWILFHWSVFWPGRGGIQSTSINHWGSPGLGSWTPRLLPIHYITGPHGFSYHFYVDDTQLSLISTRWSNGSCTISGCLADISAWMKEHHLQFNLAKTELLVFPANPTLQHDFTIQLG